MVLTESNSVELGSKAPKFMLKDVTSDKLVSYDDVSGKQATVVMFICNHCPFVKHVNEELVRLANEYAPQDVGFVAISSNDVDTHPQDSPEKMKEVANRLDYPFPYLYDNSQEVAKAFEAACTPDFFVYDANDKLVYHGQLDDSRPNNGVADGTDLRSALNRVLAGEKPLAEQKPSVGCNIKWKE